MHDTEDRLRQQGAELEEKDRQLEGVRRKAREAEAHVNRLQPLVQQREREIEVRRVRVGPETDGADDVTLTCFRT